MASKVLFFDPLITIPTLIALLFFAYPSNATIDFAPAPTTRVPPRDLCKFTTHPSYCTSLLPHQTADSYTYGRYCVGKSNSHSRAFYNLVDRYLEMYRSTLSEPEVRALEDCSLLAGLNTDFIWRSYQTVNATSITLPTSKADDVQSLLSAILTNQQTCFDSLQATFSAGSVKNGLLVPLLNDTKLYSLSLDIVTRAWVPKKKIGTMWRPTKKQRLFTNGRFPFKMSGRIRAFYESVIKRRFAEQAGDNDDEILVSDMVVVSQDGRANFSTITDAINVAPNNTDGSNGYFLIYVRAGVYEEYISIPKNKKYLLIMGDGINRTVITGNRSVVDGWTTFNSATFAVVAPNFVMMYITVRNTAGAIKHQAVALRSGADLSTFYRCSFEGYQDTLYTHSLRQFYRECDIYGTVDFIFGNAAVVLQNCNIYPRLPSSGQFNAITAQGRTDPNQNTGTSIHNCTIKAATDLASSNQTVETYLGRPWKEYSRTVYMQSFMDNLIHPAGWHLWSGDFALSTLYYAEFSNAGPGSNTSNRVTWPGYHVINNATEASNFTVSNFLTGDTWLPQTRVPYTGGLI